MVTSAGPSNQLLVYYLAHRVCEGDFVHIEINMRDIAKLADGLVVNVPQVAVRVFDHSDHITNDMVALQV
jgi:hypothetical protein